MNALLLPAPVPDVLDLSIPVPPASLERARAARDGLVLLLDREHQAAADFLVALADFDRHRGWERLGHASLFAFLTRELALSKGAAYLRLTAARLLMRFPAVEAALRSGALCLSSIGELAKVLTEENVAEVLPRFTGCSSREAREVAAAIRPTAAPPVREVVARLPSNMPRTVEAEPLLVLSGAGGQAEPLGRPPGPGQAERPAGVVLTHEPNSPPPSRDLRATTEPLTADLRRLHLTVSTGFLEKVERARRGQAHSNPKASMEQVLEAALDLLLERQARRKALVRRPRETAPGSAPSPGARGEAERPRPSNSAMPATGRPSTPAAVERAVRLRDGDRCQQPMDAGGVCGSTWLVELDHVVPVALGGETSVENLRCLCFRHHQRASEALLGGAAAQRRPRGRSRPGGP